MNIDTPVKMQSRFGSNCPKCERVIVKNETIIYWTSSKRAEHFECGKKEYLTYLIKSLMDGWKEWGEGTFEEYLIMLKSMDGGKI